MVRIAETTACHGAFRRDTFAPSATALFLPAQDQRFRSGVGSAATRTRSRISTVDIGA
jgi:hypothetical protein